MKDTARAKSVRKAADRRTGLSQRLHNRLSITYYLLGTVRQESLGRGLELLQVRRRRRHDDLLLLSKLLLLLGALMLLMLFGWMALLAFASQNANHKIWIRRSMMLIAISNHHETSGKFRGKTEADIV